MKHSMKYDTQFCRLLQQDRAPARDFSTLPWKTGSLPRRRSRASLPTFLVPGKPLRRPISICDADPWQGTLRLVFQIR